MTSSRPLNRALFWSAGNQIINKAISMISTMIVFRLLSIKDVGIYAAAFVLVSMINMINDLGLVAAINRWQGRISYATRTGFTIVLSFSALLISILYFAAPFFAKVFDEPQVTNIVRVLLLTTAIDAFSSVPLAMLLREMRQKRIAIIEFISTISQLVITVFLAQQGHGAMSLAWGMVASNAISAIFIIGPHVKYLVPGFHKQTALELIRFGRHLAGSNVMTQFALNIDTIMIGRNINTSALGRYQAAFNAGSLPATTITSFLQRVTFSSLSRIQSDRQRFDKMAYAYISITMAAAILSASLLSALAEPYITSVYGDKWQTAASILVVLAILGAYRVIQSIFLDIFAALGSPQYELITSGTWLIVLLPAMYVASHISLIAVAWTHAIVSLFVLAPLILFYARKLGLDLHKVANIFTVYAIAGAICYAIAYSVNFMIGNKYSALLIGGLLGGTFFIASTFVFIKEAFRQLEISHNDEIDLNHIESLPVELPDAQSPIAP